MIFWVLYLHVLGLGLCFFIWSLVRYLGWRRNLRDRIWFRAKDELDPVLISLQAQFLLAPRLALLEAQRLLDELQGRQATQTMIASKELAAEFGTVLSRLAAAHRPTRRGETGVAFGRPAGKSRTG